MSGLWAPMPGHAVAVDVASAVPVEVGGSLDDRRAARLLAAGAMGAGFWSGGGAGFGGAAAGSGAGGLAAAATAWSAGGAGACRFWAGALCLASLAGAGAAMGVGIVRALPGYGRKFAATAAALAAAAAMAWLLSMSGGAGASRFGWGVLCSMCCSSSSNIDGAERAGRECRARRRERTCRENRERCMLN